MKTFDELWPLPCPEVVVVTGGYGTGKSTFTLSTGATPARMVVIDFEKSQKGFAAQLPCLAYHDLQSIMSTKYPTGYKMIELLAEVEAILGALKDGAQDVIVLDNASPLEDAITAYVEGHPGEFGHSAGQYQSMSGLKWGDVKTKYQQLLTRWVSRAKMIFIVVHLRDKWVGNTVQKDAFGKPVQEPKGKETLDQLSSLFVWLEAGPGGVPAAKVLKCRVDRKVYIDDPDDPPTGIPADAIAALKGEPGLISIPVLPLRLPKATWPEIREYMRNPADLANPKPGEKLSERDMSDDDRLRLRSIIAMAEAEKVNTEKALADAKVQPTSSNVPVRTNPPAAQPRSNGQQPKPAATAATGGAGQPAASQKAASPDPAIGAEPIRKAWPKYEDSITYESAILIKTPPPEQKYYVDMTDSELDDRKAKIDAYVEKNGLNDLQKEDAEYKLELIRLIKAARENVRARTPEQIKALIAEYGEHPDAVSGGLIGALVPAIEHCFPNGDGEVKRRTIMSYLTGYVSFSTMPDNMKAALVMWVKPTKDGSKWVPIAGVEREIHAILTEIETAGGQQEELPF
jgi:hypothetical protein